MNLRNIKAMNTSILRDHEDLQNVMETSTSCDIMWLAISICLKLDRPPHIITQTIGPVIYCILIPDTNTTGESQNTPTGHMTLHMRRTVNGS